MIEKLLEIIEKLDSHGKCNTEISIHIEIAKDAFIKAKY